MKHLVALPALVAGLVSLAALTPAVRAESVRPSSEPIAVSELGAKAGAQYHGDGLSVVPTPEGARLRCVFQKLEGQVTREGLWLTSTVEDFSGERFRVVAVEVGRVTPCAPGLEQSANGAHGVARPTAVLPRAGTVTVAGNLARCVRPGLTEEYSVSVDGVRQDFVVTQRPAGDGALRVELDVTGAKAEALVNGARLVLDGSGRKIAYTRLRVTDANGKELMARMEVIGNDGGDSGWAGSPLPADGAHGVTRPTMLAVLVDDAAATYPVRIDPTFSDEDWISLGSGVNGGSLFNGALALAVSGSDLYVGGNFTNAGGISATNVAKWDGSAWSALGSGVNGAVAALAVSGSDLYVGGNFKKVGGSSVTNVAKWNGSVWSALGSGVNDWVYALAVSDSDLYVGGTFTTAGGISANRVAKWNGSAWSALGSGVSGGSPFPGVYALAVSGSDLYVGGSFTNAGGNSATNIAKWNGGVWSALGSGVSAGGFNAVFALAVSGSDLYVGGQFTTAGGNSVTNVAKWDGSAWSALGAGLNAAVQALAVSGSDLYVGGQFTTAGGSSASHVAKWNGSAWSALGSGVSGNVYALAASGSDLYVGGNFTTAGGKASTNVARAFGPAVFTSVVPNPSGAEALLTFTTAPGAALHLLSSPDLITWQTNTTVNAIGVTNSVSVNLAQPQEFFRLRRLP